MTTRKRYIRTCEACGNPHTPCLEDDDGLMVCGMCLAHDEPEPDVFVKENTNELVVDFIIFVVITAFLVFCGVVVSTAKDHAATPEEPFRCVDETGHFERECP